MPYALAILWRERQRYWPAVLAVSFSALLVALQTGLLLGTFSTVSLPIDHSSADIWVGSPGVVSVDVGGPIPESFRDRLNLREITAVESYVQGFHYWRKPRGGEELCIVIGARLHSGSLGAIRELTPELRNSLSETGAVVVDEADLGRLGLRHGVGESAEINGQRVRVVGLLRGLKGLAGPYIFCSLDTSRKLLRLPEDQTIYLLARCANAADAERVAAQLRRHPNMTAFTSEQFSFESRWHWLCQAGAGIALGSMALLGLLVGAVVTSQTLYAATVASQREFAVLRAMGIPRERMSGLVLCQSFWIGIAGIALAVPAIYGLAEAAKMVGAKTLLPGWLLVFAGAVTLLMAVLSGLAALRSLRHTEPAELLR